MTTSIKKVGFLILLVAVSLLISACTSDAASSKDNSVTWKLNHIRPADTRTDDSANQFAKEVAETTEGRVNIDVFDNSQLGNYQLVQESLSLGEIEMQLATIGTRIDQTLEVAIAPYLVTNYDEAKELYNSQDGILANYISQQLDKQNIKLLAVYPQYFSSIFLAEKPVEPKNPDVSKNAKVRVPSMKSFEELGKSIGYQVTPLPSTEIFTSLQTGVVDGAIGAGTEYYYNQFRELGEYVLPLNVHFEAHYLTVSEEAFNELTDEDQQSILSVAKEFEKQAFEEAKQQQSKYEELMEENGVEVVDFSDEEIKVFADKVRKEVWPKLEGEYGGLLKDIKEELDIE